MLPHGEAATEDLPHLVAAAEDFYAARDAATSFQVCPGACADGLDTVLEARGYRRHTPMSLQAAPVAEVLAWHGHPTPEAGAADSAAARRREVHIEDRPGDAWWTVWQAGIHAGEGAARDAERALLARVEAPSAYATAAIDGEAVSIARAVADTGWAGVFDVVTLPHARGKGAAGAVLSAVAGWAQARGCQGLYLQVERDNAAAHGCTEGWGSSKWAGTTTASCRSESRSGDWCPRKDSNLRPRAPEARALSPELRGHGCGL